MDVQVGERPRSGPDESLESENGMNPDQGRRATDGAGEDLRDRRNLATWPL
jgi:hypothetical protein